MSRIGRVLLVLPLLGLGAAAPMVIRSETPPALPPEVDERSPGALPVMPFVPNAGQADPSIAYHLPGSPVGFATGGLRLGLDGGIAELSLVGAEDAEPLGLGRTPTVVSYFRGAESDWNAGLSTFERIGYPEAWPGIDARFRQGGDRLKYGFVVSPGADPSRIALTYGPASSLRLDERGRLHAATPAGSVVDEAPRAYQLAGDARVDVPVRYVVTGSQYGFELGRYDRSLPLVIDPAIVYSGFIGGSGYDGGNGIAVDEQGAAYITGYTTSGDFPATSYDTTPAGGADAFVAKVKPDGTGFVYVALLGGTGNDDYGERIVVDEAGNAYITGQANSNDFPTKVGPDLTFNGIDDAIIVKLNPSGTDLVFSGYIGGDNDDYTYGVALGPDGSVFVSGTTKSDNFPATVLDTTQDGERDAFFAKVRSDGTGLEFAGLFGGNMTDRGHGIELASGGDFYLAGVSSSTDLTGTSAFDTSHNGGDDVFLARIAGDGSAIRSLGFIGGTGSDFLNDFAKDGSGNTYLTGHTRSADFPVAVGPDLTYNGTLPDADAFVTKVDPTGMTLMFSGYVGGSMDEDFGHGIGVDATGATYLTGMTQSSDFPAVDGPDTTYNEPGPDATNNGDGFVAKVDPAGTALVYSSFLGGASSENPTQVGDVALDAGGNAYVTGETYSSEFPAMVGPDTTWAGAATFSDAFITKIQTTERCKGKRVTLLGSDGKDKLKGRSRDVVSALGGNDKIKTGGGKDIVCAGAGKDKVNGGGGKDILLGQGGKDRLNGGGGSKDVCRGAAGKDDIGQSCEKGK